MAIVVRVRLERLFIVVIASLAISVGSAPNAWAELKAYEGFDYTAGAGLNGLAGGTGWDLPPDDPNYTDFEEMFPGWDSLQAAIFADVIQADSLTYTDGLGNQLETSGGKLLMTGSGGTSQGGRFLAERRSTGSTWLSYLSRRIGTLSADGTYVRGANLATFDMFRGTTLERLDIGPENSTISWLNPDTMAPEDRFMLRYPDVRFTILNTNLPPADQPPTENNNTAAGAVDRYRDVFTEVGIDEPVLFVMRIDHVAGGNDNIYFWLNPDLNSTPLDSEASGRYLDAHIQAAAAAAMPPVLDPYANSAATGDGEQSFDRIRLFAGNVSGVNPYAELLLDELRIGEAFADVTPFIPPAGLPGDFNGDEKVDAGDYVRWRNNLGDADETDINDNGDGGGVGLSDYGVWKTNYGNPPGSGGLAIPEPSSVLLALVAVVGTFGFRRRAA